MTFHYSRLPLVVAFNHDNVNVNLWCAYLTRTIVLYPGSLVRYNVHFTSRSPGVKIEDVCKWQACLKHRRFEDNSLGSLLVTIIHRHVKQHYSATSPRTTSLLVTSHRILVYLFGNCFRCLQGGHKWLRILVSLQMKDNHDQQVWGNSIMCLYDWWPFWIGHWPRKCGMKVMYCATWSLPMPQVLA